MSTELLQKQLKEYLSGIPNRKAFALMRKERNVLGCYKIIGNYHKAKQKNELEEHANVSSKGV